MYSVSERNKILNIIKSFLKKNFSIKGVLLVGSTAKGFKDIYSDIDIIIVVDENNFNPICKYIESIMNDKFQLLQYCSGEENKYKKIYLFLLDNFLEIDFVIVTLDNISPRDKWKLVFDRSNQIEEKLTEMKEKIPEQIKLSEKDYEEIVKSIWYHIIQSGKAIKRNQSWKALKQIERIRDAAIELNGKLYEYKTLDFSEVDEMDIEFLNELERTLLYKLTQKNLKDSLIKCVNLFFCIAKKIDNKLGVTFSKNLSNKMNKYLEQIKQEDFT